MTVVVLLVVGIGAISTCLWFWRYEHRVDMESRNGGSFRTGTNSDGDTRSNRKEVPTIQEKKI